MKDLKSLGAVLNKSQQKEINGGFGGNCPSPGELCDPLTFNGATTCLTAETICCINETVMTGSACFGGGIGPFRLI
ncbi:MAG: hypothetical protein AAFN93_18485 [Bacteroidota bacterium]